MVQGIIGSSLPELNVGSTIGGIMDQFSNLGLDSTIPSMDSMLNCLSMICGVNVDSRISSMNSMASSMNVTEFGSLDVDTIYNTAGLTPLQVSSMNSTMSTINSVKSNITNTFDSCTTILNQSRPAPGGVWV